MDKTEIINRIIELQRRINRAQRLNTSDAWMELNLTVPQVKSLFFIVTQESTNFRKLAAALRVTPSNVTGIIDRLAEQGLVSRQENPEDRRVSILRATAKGEALVTSLRERTIEYMSEVLGHLHLDELTTVVHGLTLLSRAVGSNEPEAVTNTVMGSTTTTQDRAPQPR